MAKYLKIPLINSFKFVPISATSGTHFDDDWFCKQRRWWQVPVSYRQKWEKADTTVIQIESTIQPDDLKLYSESKQVAKQFAWNKVFQGVSYAVYEATVDTSDVAEGLHFLYIKCNDGAGTVFEAISEAIDIKESWPNTGFFKYRNSFNAHGIMWTTGLVMGFRCEADIPPNEFQPEMDRTAFTNQISAVQTLWSAPWRSFKLYVGDEKGVAPWVVDVLNRLTGCTLWTFNDKRYERLVNAKWDMKSLNTMPTVGASVEVTDAAGDSALNFASGLGDGNDGSGSSLGQIITSYNIQTTFFGGGALVPVTDIENQS